MKNNEYQSIRFNRKKSQRSSSHDRNQSAKKELDLYTDENYVDSQLKIVQKQMPQNSNNRRNQGFKFLQKEAKTNRSTKSNPKPSSKRALRGRSEQFRSQNENHDGWQSNSNHKNRKLSVRKAEPKKDQDTQSNYHEQEAYISANDNTPGYSMRSSKLARHPPATAPQSKYKAHKLNMSPLQVKSSFKNRRPLSRDHQRPAQNQDLFDIMMDDNGNQPKKVKKGIAYHTNAVPSELIVLDNQRTQKLVEIRAKSIPPYDLGGHLLENKINKVFSPQNIRTQINPYNKDKGESNPTTAQFSKLIEQKMQDFFNVELKNKREPNQRALSDVVNKNSGPNSQSNSPVRVEGGINGSTVSRKYTFYVYGGNYPKFIEDALEKRGIWKIFEKINQVGSKSICSVNFDNLTSADLKPFNQISDNCRYLQQKIKHCQFELQNLKNLQKYSHTFKMSMNSNEPADTDKMYADQQKAALNKIKGFEAQLQEEANKKNKLKDDFRKEKELKVKNLELGKKNSLIKHNPGHDEAVIEKCHFIWKPFNFHDNVLQRKIDKRLIRCSAGTPMVFNHFECLKAIGTKSGLIRSLRQYYYTNQHAKMCGYTVFDTTPTTFLITSRQSEDQQMTELMLRFKQLQKQLAPKEKVPMKHCHQNIWLVKPTNMNQGKGIEIFSDLDKMINFINTRQTGSQCVVQKYIERPLLYRNRKFDIRVWAVMTTSNEIYYFKKGYLRTSSAAYTLDQSDTLIHLTNQCLQIKNKEIYGQHEEGNTLSFDEFQDYLDSPEFIESRPEMADGKNRISIQRDIVPRMKDIIIDSFCGVKTQMNPNHRKNHFELFGYDFLIDEDFRTWLVEVNSNPYIGTPCKYMKDLVPKMLDEAFNKVLDPYFPPDKSYQPVQDKNFELIFKESSLGMSYNYPHQIGVINQISPFRNRPSNLETQIVNQRRPFSHALLYPNNMLKAMALQLKGGSAKKTKSLIRIITRQLPKLNSDEKKKSPEESNQKTNNKILRKKSSVCVSAKGSIKKSDQRKRPVSMYGKQANKPQNKNPSMFMRQSRTSFHPEVKKEPSTAKRLKKLTDLQSQSPPKETQKIKNYLQNIRDSNINGKNKSVQSLHDYQAAQINMKSVNLQQMMLSNEKTENTRYQMTSDNAEIIENIILETVLDDFTSPQKIMKILEVQSLSAEPKQEIEIELKQEREIKLQIPSFERAINPIKSSHEMELKHQKSVPQSARVGFTPYMPEKQIQINYKEQSTIDRASLERLTVGSILAKSDSLLFRQNLANSSTELNLEGKINFYLSLSTTRRANQKLKSQVFNSIIKYLQTEIQTELESQQELLALKLSQFFESLDKVTNINHTNHCTPSTLFQMITLAIKVDTQISLLIQKAILEFIVNTQSPEKLKEQIISSPNIIPQLIMLHRHMVSNSQEQKDCQSETNGPPRNTAIRSIKKKNTKTASECAEKLEDLMIAITCIRQARMSQKVFPNQVYQNRNSLNSSNALQSQSNNNLLFLSCIRLGLLSYLACVPRISSFILTCLNNQDIVQISKQVCLLTHSEIKTLAQIISQSNHKSKPDKEKQLKTLLNLKTQQITSPSKIYGNEILQQPSLLPNSCNQRSIKSNEIPSQIFIKTKSDKNTPIKRETIKLKIKPKELTQQKSGGEYVLSLENSDQKPALIENTQQESAQKDPAAEYDTVIQIGPCKLDKIIEEVKEASKTEIKEALMTEVKKAHMTDVLKAMDKLTDVLKVIDKLPKPIYQPSQNVHVSTETAHQELKKQLSQCNQLSEQNSTKMIDIQSKINDVTQQNIRFASNIFGNNKIQSPMAQNQKTNSFQIQKSQSKKQLNNGTFSSQRKRLSFSVVTHNKVPIKRKTIQQDVKKSSEIKPFIRTASKSLVDIENQQTFLPNNGAVHQMPVYNKKELQTNPLDNFIKKKQSKNVMGLSTILKTQTKAIGESKMSFLRPKMTLQEKEQIAFQNFAKTIYKDSSVSKIDSMSQSLLTNHKSTQNTRNFMPNSSLKSSSYLNNSKSTTKGSFQQNQKSLKKLNEQPKDKKIKKYLNNLVNESFESSPSPIKNEIQPSKKTNHQNKDYYKVDTRLNQPRNSELNNTTSFENPYVLKYSPIKNNHQTNGSFVQSPVRLTKPVRS